MTLEVTEKLNFLKNKEEKLIVEKEIKKNSILKTKDEDKKNTLMQEFKVLNGTYVDIVHMMAKLQEIHKKTHKD